MKTTKTQIKHVTLSGGPLDGMQVSIARSAETYIVGQVFWVYEYAGKVDHKEIFAIRPNTRIARRFITWHVDKIGRDPRIESQTIKLNPVRNPDRIAHGRGAVKRAAKRVT